MKAKYAYLLSAGKGTRMGKVGTVLPKVLWPVGDKTLLEWQYQYCQDLNIGEIYLNAHHCASKIKEFISHKNLNIMVLEEPELLGSGGAIHNFISKTKVLDEVLVLNTDQFLFFDLQIEQQKVYESFSKNGTALLLCISFNPELDSYNQLVIEDNLLKKILNTYSKSIDPVTFSGVSLINTYNLSASISNLTGGLNSSLNNSLDKPRPSSFFTTVADYKNEPVYTYLPKDLTYIDFGTLSRYVSSLQRLNSEEISFFTSGMASASNSNGKKSQILSELTILGERFCLSCIDSPPSPGVAGTSTFRVQYAETFEDFTCDNYIQAAGGVSV